MQTIAVTQSSACAQEHHQTTCSIAFTICDIPNIENEFLQKVIQFKLQRDKN